MQLYAEYCHERLAKMITRGAKHGQKKPTDDDIAHAMVSLVDRGSGAFVR